MSKPRFQHIAAAAPPDPEARPRRPVRRFNSDQKQRIISGIAAAPPGTVRMFVFRRS